MLLGTLTGVVRDAISGQVLDGALVRVGPSLQTTSGADGVFTLTNVPLGTQTLQTERAGFVIDTRALTVVGGVNPAITVALTPVRPLGDLTLVLTWGSQPPDLDSHLSGPDTSGGRFHLFYQNRTSPPVPYVNLDLDDTTGQGPETITIRRHPATGAFIPGEYRYWVHNFSQSPEFAGSNARVAIGQDANQLAEFRIGDAAGDPQLDIWYVVALNVDTAGNVTVTTVQTLRDGTQATTP